MKSLFQKNALRRLSIFLFVITIAFAAFYGWRKWTASSASPPHTMEKVVTVHRAQKETIQNKVQVIGTIESLEQTTLRARHSGIVHLYAQEGTHVKKGTILAVIQNQDQEKSYAALKETQEIAQIQVERADALLKLNALSKTMVEDKKLTLLEARRRAADAASALEENRLRAPFDGIVGFFKLKNGSQVQPGDALVQFYNPHSLVVRFDLPLEIAGQVHKETSVWVHGKSYPLTHLQKMIDEETRMCPAYACIQCPSCIIGGTADVQIVLKEHKDVLVIPFEAIFLKAGSPFVYVAHQDKAVLTSVVPGIRDQERVEIISGLMEGDPIITEGQPFLYDGASIRLENGSSPQSA